MSVLGRLALGFAFALATVGGSDVAFGADIGLPDAGKTVSEATAKAGDLAGQQSGKSEQSTEQSTPAPQVQQAAPSTADKAPSAPAEPVASAAAATKSATQGAVTAATQTVDQVAAPVADVAAPVAPAVTTVSQATNTVEQAAAPVVTKVEAATAPVAHAAEATVASGVDVVEQTAAPVVEKVAQPLVEKVAQAAAPVVENVAQTAAPATPTKSTVPAEKAPTTAGAAASETEGAALEVSTSGSDLTQALAQSPAPVPPTAPTTRTFGLNAPTPTMHDVVASGVEARHPSLPVAPPSLRTSTPLLSAGDIAPASAVGKTRSPVAANVPLPGERSPGVPHEGSGSAGPSPFSYIGFFAALLAAVALAAQRLSRWLRLTPDLLGPPPLISILERPG